MLKQNLCESSSIKNVYTSSIDDRTKRAINSADVICINDTSEKTNIYTDIDLNAAFYNKFSKKSKYELADFSDAYKNNCVYSKSNQKNKTSARTYMGNKRTYSGF